MKKSPPKKREHAITPERFIPPDVDAELTPKVRALVHSQIDANDELKGRIDIQEAKVAFSMSPRKWLQHVLNCSPLFGCSLLFFNGTFFDGSGQSPKHAYEASVCLFR